MGIAFAEATEVYEAATAEAANATASSALATVIPIIVIGIILLIVMRKVKDDTNGLGDHSKIVAALLAFFLGITGAHDYYIGYRKKGVLHTFGFVCLIFGWACYASAILVRETAPLVLAVIFLLIGAASGIWAFVEFIQILTGSLLPANRKPYAENGGTTKVIEHTASASDSADALEKLAKLHEQGFLTDEEFQKKKTELLAKM